MGLGGRGDGRGGGRAPPGRHEPSVPPREPSSTNVESLKDRIVRRIAAGGARPSSDTPALLQAPPRQAPPRQEGERSRTPSPTRADAGSSAAAQLFCSDLPEAISSSNALRDAFGAHGVVTTAILLPADPTRPAPRLRQGYVSYATVADTGRALQAMHGAIMYGQRIKVQWAERPSPRALDGRAAAALAGTRERGPKGANLVIFNIPLTYTDADVLELARPHGNVVFCRVLEPPTRPRSRRDGALTSRVPAANQVAKHRGDDGRCESGRSRGYAFFSYDDVASAQRAIAALSCRWVEGKRLDPKLSKEN